MSVYANMTQNAIVENVQESYKGLRDHNPLMVQRFGADPYALVYDGRVYIYMTGDEFTYAPDGSVNENTYGNINTINVISSDDLVNWTDHGTIYAAGKDGAASWGNNSWAPAAAYKKIDGKDRFFLYFANNGNGIAVLSADSPIGPFTDPLGEALISRKTPTCAEVTWLFDPAVLMDDDGSAYIYFGGGVPSPEEAENPGTARVAKLSDDMIHLASDPKPIENVMYLFEDSGINKIGDKYYYSYCSNFDVTKGAEAKYGFSKGEIVTMISNDPMGPFEPGNPILKNPEVFFGLGGNNHHCIFSFEGKYYIAYHSRILEEKMGIKSGYRSTNIDEVSFDNEGNPAASCGTRKGVRQLKPIDAFEETKAVTMSNSAGIKTTQFGKEAEEYGSGEMIVTDISNGSWICASGVDFGIDGSDSLEIKLRGFGNGAVHVRIEDPKGEEAGMAKINAFGDAMQTVKISLNKKIVGKHDLYFVFEGEGYEMYSWKFFE